MVRARQILAFDRLLARVSVESGNQMVLKGGRCLELRCRRARTTKDIDLRTAGATEPAVQQLLAAARQDLGDGLRFEIQADPRQAEIRADGLTRAGRRFRVDCRIAGKPWAQSFGVDLAFDDPLLGEPELLPGTDMLAFVDIPPALFPAYPIESHIAEKLHAYTLPRTRPNSRIKDLPDLALLATIQPLAADRIREALRLTFAFRGTHAVPTMLPQPPASWRRHYAALAASDRLPWADLDAVTTAAAVFLDPVLTDQGGTWNPAAFCWNPH
ncbi:MAG: nucleotidyl transferase AbiEii/AbiGii toxin family protein [Planctomycetes bacterium]|nr:nucleotidyl transferase AbiEii/AbiGii toxin family protein [Planctomycetota bacterium]